MRSQLKSLPGKEPTTNFIHPVTASQGWNMCWVPGKLNKAFDFRGRVLLNGIIKLGFFLPALVSSIPVVILVIVWFFHGLSPSQILSKGGIALCCVGMIKDSHCQDIALALEMLADRILLELNHSAAEGFQRPAPSLRPGPGPDGHSSPRPQVGPGRRCLLPQLRAHPEAFCPQICLYAIFSLL